MILKVSIGGRNITKSALAEEQQELDVLAGSLDKTYIWYKI